VIEAAIAQHLTVRHAVERNASGETQIPDSGFRTKRSRQAQHDLVGHRLDRRGQVHVMLQERFVGLAGSPAEEIVKLTVGHGKPGAIIEIRLVQPERAVGLDVTRCSKILCAYFGSP
jgi:hypothetical protein